MSILDKIKGAFSSSEESGYLGYYSLDPKDEEKNKKLLNDNEQILARLKNITNGLQVNDRNPAKDQEIMARLLKEGSGQ